MLGLADDPSGYTLAYFPYGISYILATKIIGVLVIVAVIGSVNVILLNIRL